MISCDPRAGSKDLLDPLQKRGLPVELKQMEFGDLAFIGNGPNGRPVSIGIEHKTLSDMLSCLATSRFTGHQMPGLRRQYESAWLLVENRWLVDQEGYLMMLRRGGLERLAWGRGNGMQRRTLQKHLMSIEFCAGIHVRLTETREETLDWIHSLYSWWTGKEFEQHGSDFGWAPPEAWVAEAADSGELKPWSGARQWARLIPGLGAKFSKVAAEFAKHRPENLGPITEEEWAGLQYPGGKRLGPAKAKSIKRWMRGDK